MFLFQDVDGAKDYFKRKVTFIEEQIDKVMQLSMEKSKLSRGIYAFFSSQILEVVYQAMYGSEGEIFCFLLMIVICLHLPRNLNSMLESCLKSYTELSNQFYTICPCFFSAPWRNFSSYNIIT
jgi:hypothetical protein